MVTHACNSSTGKVEAEVSLGSQASPIDEFQARDPVSKVVDRFLKCHSKFSYGLHTYTHVCTTTHMNTPHTRHFISSFRRVIYFTKSLMGSGVFRVVWPWTSLLRL